FPFAQELLSVFYHLGLLLGIVFTHACGYKFFLLLFMLRIKGNIIFTYEFIAFQTSAFRRFSIAKHLPSQHAFTDMNATVVDDLYLGYFVAVRLQQAAN